MKAATVSWTLERHLPSPSILTTEQRAGDPESVSEPRAALGARRQLLHRRAGLAPKTDDAHP